MGPMGPMGPMGMPIDSNFYQIDQTVGAPPPQLPEDGEQHFNEYYLTSNGPEVGAPPPDMDPQNEQHYQFDQDPQQQMVGGPLDDVLDVNICYQSVCSVRVIVSFSYSHSIYSEAMKIHLMTTT